MSDIINLIKNFLIILISSIVILVFCELFLRAKHSIIPNYDIEMWKYSKLLKTKSKNPMIGHVHIPNKKAILQKQEIKINNIGQRGKDLDINKLDEYDRKIMFIGSSMLLGWGVEYEKIFTSIIKKKADNDNKNWLILNGGVGNYNTTRYVENYLENWSEIEIDDLIVAYFVNDTEMLKQQNPNFFEKHTHLGVLIWKFINSQKNIFKNENVINYYKAIYEDDFEGFNLAKNELKKLNSHCIMKNIKCRIILIPDVFNIKPYEFKFINEKIINFSKKNNIEYYDLLDDLQKYEDTKLMNDYNDRHINAFSHNIIGEKLYEILN